MSTKCAVHSCVLVLNNTQMQCYGTEAEHFVIEYVIALRN